MAVDDIKIGFNAFWNESLEVREGAFETLRRERPVAFMEEEGLGEIWPAGPGFYALSRQTDILEASRHPELFSSDAGITWGDIPDIYPELRELTETSFKSMIQMDDPRHARLRKIVSAGFTPRMLAKVEEDVQRAATEIVDDLIEAGETDFVRDVSARLPLKIICDMMAIPESEYETVFDQTNIILANGDPEYIPEGSNPIEAPLAASFALIELMKSVVESRRGKEGDDLTTALANAEVDGEKLTLDEIGAFFVLLCAAGNETTRNAISWGLHLLTENPDQKQLWLDDIEGVTPTAVEEIVRIASPVIYMRRTVTQDGVRLSDHEFSAGDKVAMFYWSANRDESMYDDPYVFNVQRAPNHHIGFGGPGPHFCLGAHLARREIGVMFRELLSRTPNLVATAAPQRLENAPFINGIKRFPCSV